MMHPPEILCYLIINGRKTQGRRRKMSFSETMEKRRSVRAFQKKAVPQKVLQDILQVALRAPSWGTTQPWKITAVGGETLKARSEEFVKKASAGEPPHPTVIFQGWVFPQE